MGTSAPKPVVDPVEGKTGTVPRRVRRSRSEGLSPVFLATIRIPGPACRKACPARSYGGTATRSRRVFLSLDYKEEQLRLESLKRAIDVTDKQLDELAYGLTGKEVRVVKDDEK